MKRRIFWGKLDVGCVADSGFGHDHVRETLHDLLCCLVQEDKPTPYGICLALEALAQPMSDDAWEEDSAIELLNMHTAEGYAWDFVDGDLVLWSDEQWEDYHG